MQNTHQRRLFSVPRLLAAGLLLFLIILSMQQSSDAQTFTQGYSTEQSLQRGMLIQLKKNDATKIEALSQSTADRMYGLVVDPNDAPVTLSTDKEKLFVATNGQFDALVSTQNGKISKGDYVTISAIDGIGMKSDDKQPVIIGRALEDFDGKTSVLSTAKIKNSVGTTTTVNIGRVGVNIGVAKNPLLKATEPNLPEALRRVAEAVAGKPVNPVRVYLSIVIFCISTIVSGVLLYGGVRSAIISIGRNPLSKKSIIRSMIQVVLVGLTIFISGVFGVYLILKL
jgi:hypothetical protein